MHLFCIRVNWKCVHTKVMRSVMLISMQSSLLVQYRCIYNRASYSSLIGRGTRLVLSSNLLLGLLDEVPALVSSVLELYFGLAFGGEQP